MCVCAPKNSSQRPLGPLQPNSVPEAPWQEVTCDFITQLPPSDNYDAIFVVVDRLTKQVHFAPTRSDVTAEQTAELFIHNVWKLHGTPRKVISDRGPQFASKFMQETFRRMGVTSAMSTAYHPQTDGQTERVNQELEQYLRAFVDQRQSNWASLLPFAEFAHNTRAHSATRVSPFHALYGYEPEFTVTPSPALSRVPKAEERLEEIQQVQQEARAALEVAADRMKRYYDAAVREAPELQVGDMVWLDARNVTVERARKLSPRRLGPYKVKRRIGQQNYELELPRTMRIHPVFHVSLLTKQVVDEILGRQRQPPPTVRIGNEEQYEVEEIRDVKWNARTQRLRFYIRWKGYLPSEDSWEDDGDVFARDKIHAFYSAQNS